MHKKINSQFSGCNSHVVNEPSLVIISKFNKYIGQKSWDFWRQLLEEFVKMILWNRALEVTVTKKLGRRSPPGLHLDASGSIFSVSWKINDLHSCSFSIDGDTLWAELVLPCFLLLSAISLSSSSSVYKANVGEKTWFLLSSSQFLELQ